MASSTRIICASYAYGNGRAMTAPNLFGIGGLTIGGAGVWAIFGTIIIWWVRGMPERRRAQNERMTAEDKAAGEARAQLFSQMQEQLKSMMAEVARLKTRIEEVEEKNRIYLTELIELRGQNQIEGRVRQLAQTVVSADRKEGSRQ